MKTKLSLSLPLCVNTFSLFALTALSLLLLTSPSTSAVVTTTTVTIDESCTMTSITNSAHVATLLNGTYSGTDYTTGIGSTTLKTFCNDNAGYAIYAIGYTNDTYGNTKLHWNKASSLSDDTNDIETALYTQGTTINSTWSMKLASSGGTYATTIVNGTNNEEDFTTWHEVPDEYTKVAYRTSGTDMEVNGSGEGSSITVTYDSYISAGQPAGAYNGKVKYALVHPSTHTTPSPVYIMQDIANWENKLDIGDEVQAIDSRDDKVYYVAKLADGNIWMTQNLDHDIDSSYNYNSTNTDVPNGWNDTLTDTYVTNNMTWEGSWSTPESYDPGNLCWNGNLKTDGGGTFATETITCTQNGNHYHIGNYYNWTAAVAMEDSSSYITDDADVDQSICPAGWMLPKNGFALTGSGSFINLVTEYDWDDSENMFIGSYTAWGSPLNLTLSGGWSNNGSAGVATFGALWSSVTKDWEYYTAYELYITADNSVYPQVGDNRAEGISVRCVARSYST